MEKLKQYIKEHKKIIGSVIILVGIVVAVAIILL